MIEPNYDALPDEFKQKLAKWEANKPANLSLRALEDIALMVQDIGETVSQKGYGEDLTQLGTVLLDIRETMQAIRDKEDPETLDVTTPLLKAFDKLEKAIKESVGKIDVKPELKPNINVEAPNVTVAASKVDTSKIESILKKDLPQAFSEAIAAIPPVEIPEPVDRWDEVLESLENIDTGTRLKTQFPSTLKVTNPDGTAINDDIDYATRIDDSADPILYIGKAAVGSDEADPVWQIAKLDTSSGLIKTWADSAGFTQVWDNRGSLTYN